MNVTILGTKYEIGYVHLLENDMAGKTDFINKKIYIIDDPKQALDIVLKHELMHAFFFEAGLLDYAKDEMLVDFLAVQFSKIEKMFKDGLDV